MALALIYAPFSGRITNLDNGVCVPHFACSGESGLVEIGTCGALTVLYLYVSYPAVVKVYIYTRTLSCCKAPGGYGLTRIVDLYATNNRYLGSI